MTAKFLVLGTGAKLSMISLDLINDAEALALARRIATSTGRAVTVRDADGVVMATIEAAPKN